MTAKLRRERQGRQGAAADDSKGECQSIAREYAAKPVVASHPDAATNDPKVPLCSDEPRAGKLLGPGSREIRRLQKALLLRHRLACGETEVASVGPRE